MKINKKKGIIIFFLILIETFLVINVASAGEPKLKKRYTILENGELELNVPITWQAKDYMNQEDMPLTIVFRPARGDDFRFLITVLWNKTGEKNFNSPEKIRKLVEREGYLLLSKAVEKKLVVHQMRGVYNVGYFFSLTDKAPHPGEFLYLTRGGMAVGNLLLSITVLYRVQDSEHLKEAMTVLREAKHHMK